jgi:2-polyprenyl-6-hydroxyphenyl methylase/3-demethylubiquinone-9 3-methyltransferase
MNKYNSDEHFDFGQNWQNFSNLVDAGRIEEAKKNLIEVLGSEKIKGKTILDIGCGSGIHSLAFLELEAAHVVAFDFDLKSVDTSINLLKEYSKINNWEVYQSDILSPKKNDVQYDVVYSWGVLHHTGNLELAIMNAASYVKENGYLFIAIYKKTKLCRLWQKEKRFYSTTSNFNQRLIRIIYITLFGFHYTLFNRKSFRYYINNYQKNRGMSFYHDVHDWLGGFPYESASRKEINQLLTKLNFSLVKEVSTRAGIGIFGSGCNEYVFKKC